MDDSELIRKAYAKFAKRHKYPTYRDRHVAAIRAAIARRQERERKLRETGGASNLSL